VIYGHTDSGDDCCLFPAMEINSHWTHTHVITTDVSGEYLLVGTHAKSLAQIQVCTVSASMTSLESWLGQPAIVTNFERQPDGTMHHAHVNICLLQSNRRSSQFRRSCIADPVSASRAAAITLNGSSATV
jgi:hypothetical protein